MNFNLLPFSHTSKPLPRENAQNPPENSLPQENLQGPYSQEIILDPKFS